MKPEYIKTDKPYTVALSKISPITNLVILRKMTIAVMLRLISRLLDCAFVVDFEDEEQAVELFDGVMELLRTHNPVGDWDLRLFVHNTETKLLKNSSTVLYTGSDCMGEFSNLDLLLE